MPAELNLPDLPEVPLRLPAVPGTHVNRLRLPLAVRLRDALANYLPLLLMALLALGTWWLVKNTPASSNAAAAVSPPGVPDYTMQRFALERFGADGRLVARIEGDVLRHYPADDRIEIDNASIHAWSPQGVLTRATGQQALITEKGDRVTLRGGARVEQKAEQLLIESEFLQVHTQAEWVKTPQPVLVTARGSVLRAGSMSYEHATQRLELGPPIRATLQTQNLKAPAAKAAP